MKNYRSLYFIIAACFFAVSACTSEDDTASTDQGECTDGETQCIGTMVQMCDLGTWIDWDDCAIQGMTCDLVGGESICIDTGSGDSDTDSDTDSDSDGDSDSDTGECTEDITWPADNTLALFAQMELGLPVPNWEMDGFWDSNNDGVTEQEQVNFTAEDIHCIGEDFMLVITGADW